MKTKKLLCVPLAASLICFSAAGVCGNDATTVISASNPTRLEAESYNSAYLAQIQTPSADVTNIGYMDSKDENGNYAQVIYNLTVEAAGYYDLVMSDAINAGYHPDVASFSVNGQDCGITFDCCSTNDWFRFREYELGKIYLPAGEITFKLTSKGSMGNVDYFIFIPNNTPSAELPIDAPVFLGDTNKDKTISAADALLALQSAVQKIIPDSEQLLNADVNSDGIITADDALKILQHSVGKITIKADYSVIYAAGSSDAKACAEAIATAALTETGTMPSVFSDTEQPDNSASFEILVGETNRQYSADCAARLGTEYKCSVTAEGKKLILSAKTAQYLSDVTDNFIFNYLTENGFTLTKTPNRSFRGSFVNPVSTGGDPDVLIYEGKYYMYTSGGSERFHVKVSEDLIHWEDKGVCLSEDAVGDRDFWAPEVKYHDGKLIMCYSAKSSYDNNQHLAIASADSPLGPFNPTGTQFLNSSTPSELDDSLFFDDDGQGYIYFARWIPSEQQEVLFGARLRDDYSGYYGETRLFGPELSWEKQSGAITEAPHVIKHGEGYYLTYSANTVDSEYYGVGCAVSAQPLGPFTKYSEPILCRTDDVKAPGHHTFTYSLDGSEMFIVYHSWDYTDTMGERRIRLDRCGFTKNPDGGYDVLKVFGPSFDSVLTPANN